MAKEKNWKIFIFLRIILFNLTCQVRFWLNRMENMFFFFAFVFVWRSRQKKSSRFSLTSATESFAAWFRYAERKFFIVIRLNFYFQFYRKLLKYSRMSGNSSSNHSLKETPFDLWLQLWILSKEKKNAARIVEAHSTHS